MIRTPQELNFNEEVGVRVDMHNNSSCLDYYHLFFTENVYQLIVDESIRFERQQRQLPDNTQGDLYNFTVPELKAWLRLTKSFLVY